MRNPLRTLIPCSVLLALCFSAAPAEAQIWKKVKDRAKQATEREVLREVDRKVTATVRCTLGDQSCIDKAQSEGNEVEVVDASGKVVAPGSTPAASAKPGEGAWANYDFVPGDRVLYFEDFESTPTGNVPNRVDFQQGVMEVVQLQGGQVLRFTSESAFAIPLPESLPDRFTIEFDAYLPHYWHYLTLGTGPLADPAKEYKVFQGDLRNHEAAEFTVSKQFKTGVRKGQSGGESLAEQDAFAKGFVPVRITVDGQYVKMYLGETRVANVPNADIQRSGRILVGVNGEVNEEHPAYVDNIRVAAGARQVFYDKLMSDGRVATRGILFDTGSDRIQPESTPTLKQIGEMLKQHSALRLAIEGHTDAVGDDAANQALSEKRAAAVKQHLVANYGVDAARLEAKGMGESKPMASNDTAEGKQQNRRVELVRL
ncbi:hypothetical protein BH20GEM2_BH20GEM2_13650 [soil metagenome]